MLALFIPVLPGGVVAQDGDSIRLSDSFVVEGDSASADVIYTCTISEPDVRWRLEATRPAEDVGITVDLRDADEGLSLRSSGSGKAGLPGLALEPGDYTIRIERFGEGSLPFTLARVTRRRATTLSPMTEPIWPRPSRPRVRPQGAWPGTALTRTTSRC